LGNKSGGITRLGIEEDLSREKEEGKRNKKKEY
jgi:hypothetical protein